MYECGHLWCSNEKSTHNSLDTFKIGICVYVVFWLGLSSHKSCLLCQYQTLSRVNHCVSENLWRCDWGWNSKHLQAGRRLKFIRQRCALSTRKWSTKRRLLSTVGEAIFLRFPCFYCCHRSSAEHRTSQYIIKWNKLHNWSDRIATCFAFANIRHLAVWRQIGGVGAPFSLFLSRVMFVNYPNWFRLDESHVSMFGIKTANWIFFVLTSTQSRARSSSSIFFCMRDT